MRLAVALLAAQLSAGDALREARTLSERTEALLRAGQVSPALETARAALAAARRSGDAGQVARCLDTLGNALYFAEDVAGAEAAFLESARLMRETGNAAGEATALKDAGIAARAQGKFDAALERLSAAEVTFRRLGETDALVSTLQNLGMAFESIGLPERTFELYREAIALAESGGDLEVAEGNAVRLGYLLTSHGDPQRGAVEFRRALGLSRRRGVPVSAWTLMGLSWATEESGDLEEAIAVRREALRVDEQRGAPAFDIASHCDQLARLLTDRDPLAARAYLDRAVAGYLASSERLPWFGAYALASALRRRGERDRAGVWFERAMSDLEAARGRLGSEEWQGRFLDRHQALYQDAFEALRERSDAEAFLVFERSRAGTHAQMIAAARAQPIPPLPLPEVQAAISPTTVLVGYFLGRTRTWALVVSRARLDVVRLDVEPRELAARVATYRELLAAGTEDEGRAVSSRLFRDLYQPIRRHLPPATRELVVLPDGALSELPFETLSSGERPLLADLAVSTCTSATEWARLAGRRSATPSAFASRTRVDLVAFASPPPHALSSAEEPAAGLLYREEGFVLPALPAARAEVEAAARRAARTSLLFTGRDATEEAVARETAGRSIAVLHFATHGLLSERSPAHSALLLARDGRGDGLLQAREIYRLRLDAELVILSACQSARGRLLRGGGAQGLARAFLYAGARSVLATLWSVDDASAARFIEAFYRHLGAGLPKAEALRRAKLERRAASPNRDWAAFVLIGDGSAPVLLSGPPWWRRHPGAVALAGFALGLGLLLCTRGAPRHPLVAPRRRH